MGLEIISRGVYIHKGYLLVAHQKNADNVFLPGGHLNKGETAPAALVRELHEELDIHAASSEFLGVVEHAYSDQEGNVQETNLVFSFVSHELHFPDEVTSAESHLEFSWIPCKKADLKKADLQPWILQEQIELYSKGHTWPPYLSTIE